MSDYPTSDLDLEKKILRSVIGANESNFIFNKYEPDIFSEPLIKKCYGKLRAFWLQEKSLPSPKAMGTLCCEGESKETKIKINKLWKMLSKIKAQSKDDLLINYSVMKKLFITRSVTEIVQNFYHYTGM